jgi:hypothetical protein
MEGSARPMRCREVRCVDLRVLQGPAGSCSSLTSRHPSASTTDITPCITTTPPHANAGPPHSALPVLVRGDLGFHCKEGTAWLLSARLGPEADTTTWCTVTTRNWANDQGARRQREPSVQGRDILCKAWRTASTARRHMSLWGWSHPLDDITTGLRPFQYLGLHHWRGLADGCYIFPFFFFMSYEHCYGNERSQRLLYPH